MPRRPLIVALVLALAAGLAPSQPAGAAPPVPHRARPHVASAAPPPASSGVRGARPAAAGTAGASGHIPCDLYNAYAAAPAAGSDGAGQTIAVIDPYGTPTVQSDFDSFSQAFQLGGPGLVVLHPNGVDLTQPDAPGRSAVWMDEIPLGVEWVHALAPAAQVVLVEARTSTDADMIAAIDYAVGTLSADVVNMSWFFDESGPYGYDQATIRGWDAHFPPSNGAGRQVTYYAATGDSGPAPSVPAAWPAVSPNVVSVGGTSVTPAGFAGATTANHAACGPAPSPPYAPGNETPWPSGGGGPSAFEPQPAYQRGYAPGTTRVTPDIAALADPNEGVAVFESGAWAPRILGGTSLSAPIWAGLGARLNQFERVNQAGVSWLYAAYGSGPGHTGFNDVGAPGYDSATGLGSPIFSGLKQQVPFAAYFPWFDRASDPGFANDNIHVVNPNPGPAAVSVSIPGCPARNDVIPAQGERIFTCSGGFGGPVVVRGGQRLLATQRVQYRQSFNEVAAVPAPAPGPTELVFSWYDVRSPGFVSDNIHVVNPSASTATVSVDMPGMACGASQSVAAQGYAIFTCPNGFGGPVHVHSDQAVLATQRVRYFDSFNEVAAMPAAGLQPSLWLSWFDRISDAGFLSDNVHVVGRPGTRVHVDIPGCPTRSGPLDAAGQAHFTCDTGFGGPVHVTADDGSEKLAASQRVQYFQSFNEVAASPDSAAGSVLWISWFDRRSDPGFTSDDVHIVNPAAIGAGFSVTIPGCAEQTGTVAPGRDVHVTCLGGFSGPVVVRSTTAGAPVLASARVKYYRSFNEVAGAT